VPVLLYRTAATVYAPASACTHMGGPPQEGTIRDGCVTCPWPGSTFRFTDGSIVRSPASTPSPATTCASKTGASRSARQVPHLSQARWQVRGGDAVVAGLAGAVRGHWYLPQSQAVSGENTASRAAEKSGTRLICPVGWPVISPRSASASG
jgi:nitrite reductase/ring-hydroxylating ferredoxin subunit